ncbi:hypothetical protein KJ966_16955 [bacterium]|nr:hypothetical protein [bacterium]
MYYFRFLFCFIFIPISFLNCIADENLSYAILPQENSFKKDQAQTSQVLKALLFENIQLYQKAYKIWGELPDQIPLVKEHRFITGFSFPFSDSFGELPTTERSILMMVRYLTWQKKWEQALSIIEKHREILGKSVEGKLELIHIYLCLGRYDEAEKEVVELDISDRRSLMHLKILKIWLEVLRGNQTGIHEQIQQVEEDFLYLPTTSFLPSELLKEERLEKESSGISLLRFPSNQTILEELVLQYRREENWQEIEYLVQSQHYISNQPFSWLLMAELYSNSSQISKLKQLLESRRKYPVVPEFYDYLARNAIVQENWQVLRHVAEVYSRKFPDLLDGKIYEAIYFEKTGQHQKSKALYDEVGL